MEYRGLTSEEVRQRTEAGLTNRITAKQGKTEGQIILTHLFTFFNLVFLVLAAILLLSGSSPMNMTFLIVVLVNTIIGCFQEIRAKRAVDKLTLVAPHEATALRDGEFIKVRWDNLVRDDIVAFSAGDQICADAVLVDGEIQVNESLITGEADPVKKAPGDTLLSGSFLIAGRGNARLTNVGDASFAAKLASEAKKNPTAAKSEMMRSLDKLIRVVGYALIPIGLLLFYQQFSVLKLGLQQSSEATVAALVGMIPEGLYLLTSVALAVSAIKLSKKRVLVQDMNCIETLARVDVLCVDKTGTITEPSMEVENILPLTDDSPERLEAIMTALYGSREPENDTARALREMFGGESHWNCTAYFPFTSQTKWSGGDFEDQGSFLVGAPEFVMGKRFGEIAETVNSWSENGYRVLLVASYADALSEHLEAEKLTPLALVLLTSRIRENAQETFSYFAKQGVAIKVISGDNPVTVSQVAQRAGIENADTYIDATTLHSFEDILDAAEKYTVFGRVTPDQKKQLVIALQQKKHTVAMTGDGVNDVLALKQADCGIAMASGAQAASQVARLVLLDSDFGAMPHIVAEGRRVINNIQRAAALFLVKNIFSLALALITLFTSWPYPLEPLHLSIISALTIGVPSFFLAMEPNYERVHGRFITGVLRRAFPGGLTNIFVVLTAQGFMAVFDLPFTPFQTVCTAILAVVGLLVLFQVCKPFDKFRILIWALMAVALLLCFTLLRDLLSLQSGNLSTTLVMLTLLIMTPTVFFAVQRLFDLGDKVYLRVRKKKQL
ncbi:MAG: cation-translocating P-type ATPase [Oscillospiraceae bacterium]|nr:cation-translocating P-type ATPase [Oscillospiraceae bacterium]MBQ7341614.1 cation-translocating P-type ATPase [Oscillospiraceae bacterium]